MGEWPTFAIGDARPLERFEAKIRDDRLIRLDGRCRTESNAHKL
jgi:hypothetical protein